MREEDKYDWQKCMRKEDATMARGEACERSLRGDETRFVKAAWQRRLRVKSPGVKDVWICECCLGMSEVWMLSHKKAV
jgi:hypothetical protein